MAETEDARSAAQATEATEAAEAAADPDRILPEEDPTTTRPAEVRRMVRTYSQLVAFKDRLLHAAHEKLGDVTEDAARKEAVTTDLVLLEAQSHRLRRRLDYWKRRLRMLLTPDERSRVG